MDSSLKRKTILILGAAAWSGLAMLSVGCEDTATADRQAADAMAQVAASANAGEAELAGAQQILSQAVAGEVSDGVKAQANLSLAHTSLAQAQLLLRDAARYDLLAARTASEILDQAAQVHAAALKADGYRKLNPGTSKADIQNLINQARGSAEQQVWTNGLPTLAAAQQQVSKLEGEVAQVQSEISALSQQQSAAVQEAEASARQAEDLKGRESVEAFTRASNSRKQASDIGTQIDLAKARLSKLNGELEMAKGNQQAVTAAISELESQMKSLDEGWQAIQAQIEAQSALAREIVNTATALPNVDGTEQMAETTAGKSLAGRAELFKKYSDEASRLRTEAAEKIDQAEGQFGAAKASAGTALTAMTEAENQPVGANAKAALTLGKNTFSLSQYTLAQSQSAQATGRLHLSAAAAAKTRLILASAVVPVLQSAGASIPPALQEPDLAKKLKESMDLSSSALKSADETLISVAGGSTPADESAARAAAVQRALVQYDLARLAEMNGDEAGKQAALNNAGEAIKSAAELQAVLPQLPAELIKYIPEKPKEEPAPVENKTSENGAPKTEESAPQETPPAEGAAPVEGSAPAEPQAQ